MSLSILILVCFLAFVKPKVGVHFVCEYEFRLQEVEDDIVSFFEPDRGYHLTFKCLAINRLYK